MLDRLVSGLCRVYPLIEGFTDMYLVLFNLVVPVLRQLQVFHVRQYEVFRVTSGMSIRQVYLRPLVNIKLQVYTYHLYRFGATRARLPHSNIIREINKYYYNLQERLLVIHTSEVFCTRK